MLLLLISSALAGDPPPPPASPPSQADVDRARELFDNGQILFDEGRYEDAVTAWEQSYRLSGYPDLLWNISGAYERLGDFRSALAALNKYRAYAPASERETLDRRMRTIEERRARQDQENAVAVKVVSPPPRAVAPATQARRLPIVPLAVTTVGLGGLGFGLFEGLRASAAVTALGAACVEVEGGLICPDVARTDAETRRSAATTAVVGLGAGGLVTLGGLVWLALDLRDVSVTPTAGADGGGLVVAGRF